MSTLPALATTLLAKPSLEGLSYALRHPEVWPADYAKAGWNYLDCERCAMGLAAALWPEQIKYAGPLAVALAFGQEDQAEVLIDKIFISRDVWEPVGHMAAVKPHHVASAIDALLASRAEAA